MVLEVVYSVNREKLVENIEKREIEKTFFALSDEYIHESERPYNQGRKHLKIIGGKVCEKNESRITHLVVNNTKSF